ncbi:MAG: hypothetical protein JOZ22_00350, partial [Acidobacteriia bacterium]|nr:hypothetical protein [Terriglobia bacterium]
MTLPSLHWLQSETGRIQKWHLFLMLVFLALPNAVHATDCLVSPVLPCTFTLTEPFAAYANWPTQPIDFRYDGGSELVKNAKIVNGGGTELPFQWVSLCWDPTATLGCIEIQDSLPSGATRTYTLEAGPPSARVANPVVVARNNVTCYSGGARCIQLTNGLTGVQVPSPASNGSAASYRLAPIQAIGLPNGGWTGAIGGSGNPNLIYGEAQGGTWTRYYGGIPNWDTGLQTPITSATGYSEKFLEIGPLKTTIQLTYSFNRPDYWSAAAGISKYYWWFNCNAATSGQPQGSVYWAGQNGQPSVLGPGSNMTVVFDGSGFCPVGSGSAPLDSSHYYTATQIPGTQNYTLSTVIGGVTTPVIITGSTERQVPTIDGRGTNWPLTGFIINSATCPKYPSPCADGRQDEQPGRLVFTLTLYANSKSILVTEDSDILHAEYYPFYQEITPDAARFRTSRGTGTSDPRCGYSAPVSVTGVGSGPATATIATSTAVSNGQFVLLTGVGSGSNLPNGVYYLQTTSPYSATTPGVWTNSNFTGATTAPGSYTSGGLVKYAGAASGVQNSPVSDTGFDFPWTYGDSGFSEADPFPSLYQGCQISSGHLTSTPSLVVNNPPADANSVTAWENYQAGGSGSSPVLGWFTGDAGLMKQAGTMPGLYAAASGFVSGWGRTAAIQDAQRLVSIGNPALGITAPTIDNWGSQKSWGIFVDTNSNLPAFSSSTHPPIQDDQNKYTGVNLSHVYAYRSGSTSAPPGGWQWLYMANSNATNAGQQMNCLIARVRDGSSTCSGMFPDGRTATPCGGSGSTCYHDLLYNNSATDPTSRAILNMWQSEVSSPSTAVGTAITASNCPNLFSGVGASLAAGDNHFDSTYGGYLAALYINPCFSFWNAVLMDPNSTMAQQSQMTMEAAAIGGLLWDNSWTARDGSYTNNVPGTYCYLCFISVAGDGAGTDNQQVTYAQYRATLAYQYGVNGANAFLATKVPASQSSNNQTLQLSIGCAGAMSAGTHYTQTYNAALIPSAQITALQGGNTFSQCQFTQGYPTWFLATTTPPDPRYGNTRKKVALGDTATEEGDVFPGLLATGLYATNPAPAKAMSWLWHQYGTSTFQYLNYLISGLLNVDETIPQVAPSLTSQQINGYFSVHRSGTQGGGQENALWFINGGCCGQGNIYYNLSGHRHYDDGHVSIFALGAPLAGYWGANLYNPQTSDRFSQNSITFDAEMNGTSWSQNSPPFNTYGMQLLGSPTVTAFHAFGNSTQSTA